MKKQGSWRRFLPGMRDVAWAGALLLLVPLAMPPLFPAGAAAREAKRSEPIESMDDFFAENFPLEPALAELDARIARDTAEGRLWQHRATLLASHGSTEAAVASLTRALELFPKPEPRPEPPRESPGKRGGPVIRTLRDDVSARYELANLCLRLGRREEARGLLEAAIDPESPHMMACTVLGNLHLDEGRSEEALKWYGLMGHNLSTSGKVSKGNALYNLGRYGEAIAEYEVARKWKPALPSVLRNLGDALREAGRAAEAAEAYGRFLDEAAKANLPEAEIAAVREALANLAGGKETRKP